MRNCIKLWKAASFSWLLPGLGQLFIGHIFAGVLFFIIYFLFSVPFVLFFKPTFFFIFSYFGIRWILSALSVWWILRYFNETPIETDVDLIKPGCAVFLTLIWPGLGHLYIKQWGWGFFFLILAFVGWQISPIKEEVIKQPIIILFRLFVCLHIYLISFPLKRLPWRAITPFLSLLLIIMLLTNIAQPLLTQRFFVYVTTGRGDSMFPACKSGDRLLVSRLHYYFTSPKVGDIVSFDISDNLPSPYKTYFNNFNWVKRIVAVGGDIVHIKDEKIYVNNQLYKDYGDEVNQELYKNFEKDGCLFRINNGEVFFDDMNLSIPADDLDQADIERINKKFIEELGLSQYAVSKPYLVPENCYFVLGDNIYSSSDSRDYGAIPRDKIIGKVIYIR